MDDLITPLSLHHAIAPIPSSHHRLARFTIQSLDGVKLRGKANMKFWESWNADKNFVKEWGYHPVKVGREWFVEHDTRIGTEISEKLHDDCPRISMQMRLAEMAKGEDQKKYEAAVRGQRQQQRESQRVVKKRGSKRWTASIM
jgi:hypothetical protein